MPQRNGLLPGDGQGILTSALYTNDAPAAHPNAGPYLFIENVGQWPEDARYQVWHSPLGVGTTWLTEDAIWVSIVEREDVGMSEHWNVERMERSNVEPTDGQGVNVKITFTGANPNGRIEPFAPVDTTVSYFLGNDPEQWQPDVPVWGGVRYVDLYPGVDLEMSGEGGRWM